MTALASLSLDLDNLWSYQKTHGDEGWDRFPSYLDVVVPRVLDFLDRRGLTITFFVVGQDAAIVANGDALAALAGAGHEIGNHSFRHEPWLHRYDDEELDRELVRAEEAIEAATGQHPVGFRGPGYSLTESTLRVLARRGYRYDASTLPTVIGPLARAYYFRSAKLTPAQRAERSALFGGVRDAARPVGAYRWVVDGTSLVEVPVTTLPLVRLPIHVSYLLYLAGRSPAAAAAYFRGALRLCRLFGVEPSILLHPLDFLGADDVSELAFFPGMGMPGGRKVELVGAVLDELTAHHRVVPMIDHVRSLEQRSDLPTVDASRAGPASPLLAGEAAT